MPVLKRQKSHTAEKSYRRTFRLFKRRWKPWLGRNLPAKRAGGLQNIPAERAAVGSRRDVYASVQQVFLTGGNTLFLEA